MEYRAYPIASDGHRQIAITIEETSDAGAIARVKQMLDGCPIELWQSARMVGWFEKIDGEFVAVTAPPPDAATLCASAASAPPSTLQK